MEVLLSREIVSHKALCRFIGVVVMVILTSLGAFVRIRLPFTPVPITLQTLFVLLSAAFLGSSLGVVTQLSYILLGILGLPIFTGAGSGPLYLFGPTAGYLWGFVLASLFIGKFIKYSRDNFFLTLTLFCIGDLILLFSGVVWLKFIFGYHLAKLLLIGFLPFLPGDLFKALFATALFWKLKPRLKEIF
ncbi:MAG: biotin transporter BioY [Candidatus Omnitrophica bacterium]|nr:biotin transporter BioY [Candidatus Omnitrophota bacterium]